MIDRTIGHHRIVERLAAGGMGVIYRADDLTLHRPVALKFLSHETASDEEYRARFLREARVAAALNHPNTCTVYEVGQVESTDDSDGPDPIALRGTPFIAMEFIEGETLACRLTRVGRLEPREALDVASQVAEGLAEAHARGIVHRDLKPQNIMIASGGLVKIVDFGLAKPVQPSRAAHAIVSTSDMISADLGDAAIIGTCAYMSPEQASGRKLDARSDIFAFGTTLYQMLSGELPFRGDTATVVLAKILESEPEALRPYPDDVLFAALERIARRCLQKSLEDRYSDAGSLVADLEEVRRALAPRPAGTAPLAFLTALRIAVVGLVIIAAILTYAWSGRSAPQTARAPSPSARVDSPSAQAGPNTSAPEQTPQAPARRGRVPDASGAGPDSRTLQHTRKLRGAPAALPSSAPDSAPDEEALPTGAAGMRTDVGRLILESEPTASVSLDGRLVGITPLTVDTHPGTHELVMTHPDGSRWRGRVDVTAGRDVRIERNLGASGQLTVTSDVWVEISLDGGPAEQTPIQFSKVPAGLHELRAFREGFVTQTLEIFIEEGKTHHLRVNLERKP